MFLLTQEVIRDYVDRKLIDIDPYSTEKGAFGGTFYYFRLGPVLKILSDADSRMIDLHDQPQQRCTLPANGYAIIQSLEEFRCNEKVLALFGQATDLALSGFALNHGPTIDPHFKGHLKLGIKNLLARPNELHLGQKIGKASFFDISDTYPIRHPTEIAEAFDRRGNTI
jgi:deoxycytidine triphosphate deaminase